MRSSTGGKCRVGPFFKKIQKSLRATGITRTAIAIRKISRVSSDRFFLSPPIFWEIKPCPFPGRSLSEQPSEAHALLGCRSGKIPAPLKNPHGGSVRCPLAESIGFLRGAGISISRQTKSACAPDACYDWDFPGRGPRFPSRFEGGL